MALGTIATLTVMAGTLAPAKLRVAQVWAAKNRALLTGKWDELHTD